MESSASGSAGLEPAGDEKCPPDLFPALPGKHGDRRADPGPLGERDMVEVQSAGFRLFSRLLSFYSHVFGLVLMNSQFDNCGTVWAKVRVCPVRERHSPINRFISWFP